MLEVNPASDMGSAINLKLLNSILDVGRFVEAVIADWYMDVKTRGAFQLDKEKGLNQHGIDFETVAHYAIKMTIKLGQPPQADRFIGWVWKRRGHSLFFGPAGRQGDLYRSIKRTL